MHPKDKYTTFSRTDPGYRKSMHKVPKCASFVGSRLSLSMERANASLGKQGRGSRPGPTLWDSRKKKTKEAVCVCYVCVCLYHHLRNDERRIEGQRTGVSKCEGFSQNSVHNNLHSTRSQPFQHVFVCSGGKFHSAYCTRGEWKKRKRESKLTS